MINVWLAQGHPNYNIYHSLGQACNHVSTCFDVRTGQEVLATEVSKTSNLWLGISHIRRKLTQLVQRTSTSSSSVIVTCSQKMREKNQVIYKRHDFDPRLQRVHILDIHIDSVTLLLGDISESMTSTGLKHFWESNTIQHQSIQ